jgi:hypothetical protein
MFYVHYWVGYAQGITVLVPYVDEAVLRRRLVKLLCNLIIFFGRY